MAGTHDLCRRASAAAAILAAAVLGAMLYTSSSAPQDSRRRLWLSDLSLSQFADPRSAVLRGAMLPPFAETSSFVSSARYQMIEDGGRLRLEIDVPGVDPDDLTTELEDDGRVLHVFGTRGGATAVDERFRLGPGLDAAGIAAHLANGVLVVTVPRREEPAASVGIPIVRGEPPAPVELEVHGEAPDQAGAPAITDAGGQGVAAAGVQVGAPALVGGGEQGVDPVVMDGGEQGGAPVVMGGEEQGEAPTAAERRKKRKLNLATK